MDIEFSIVIPVYNIGRRLKKAIDSVIGQSFQHIEIILVDDGSTDIETLSICEKYAKEYSIIKLFHKKNGGVSSARNYGIKVATGKYITFLDGDDYLEEDAIVNYNNIIQNCIERPQIIFANYTIFNEDILESLKIGYFKSVTLYRKRDLEQLLMSLYNNSNYGWLVTTVCFKREFLLQNGVWFREELAVCEDLDWLLRLIIKADAIVTANIDSLIYNYYSRPRKGKLKRFESQVKASAYWIDYFRKSEMSENVKTIMQNIFVKLFVVFSFNIVDMSQEEKKRAYSICREKLSLARYSSSAYVKIFYAVAKIFGVKIAVNVLGRFYAIAKR